MPNSNLVALELAAIQFETMTRSSFILKGALTAGAVYGAGAVSPFVRQAFAQDGGGGGDVDILNFALTLEYLEGAFYAMALKEVKGLSGKNKQLAELLAKDEQAHIEFLQSGITDAGGEPVEAPGVDFKDAFANEKSFLTLAQTFEDTGVSAYNGAGPAFESKELLAAAGTIVQIEGRHAALIRLANGESPTIGAFDETLEMQEVLDAVMPFVKA